MAKKPAKVSVNVALLNVLAAAEAAGSFGRVTQEEAKTVEGLIEVNTADVVDNKAAARLSEAGKQYLSNLNTGEKKDKPMYGIMTNVPIPASNRGNRKGAGAPTVYPFADL